MLKRCILFGLCLGLIAFPTFGCSDDDDSDKTKDSQEQGGDEGGEEGGQEQDKDLKIKTVRSAKPYEASTIDAAALSSFVKGQYDLNFELLAKSDDQIKDKNAMISTFSIQSALGMTWAGAAGTTADEMKKALHFDDNTHQAMNKIRSEVMAGRMDAVNMEYETIDAVDVAVNNDIYVSPKYTWAEKWLDILSINYDAGVTEMNFGADPAGATKYINDVVSADTHDRIKNLIPDGVISVQTQLVLTNAIYFKAPWRNDIEFWPQTDKKFNLQDGSSVDATMIGVKKYFNYAETSEYQAVSVPLRGSHFAMMFILPAEGGYNTLVSSMNGEFVDGIFKAFSPKNIELTIPEFTFETSLSLVEPFKALGMEQAFTDGADFSGMTEEENDMSIVAILHKSFVGVGKNGVEAAAATAVVVEDSDAIEPEEFVVVDVNRPFIFMVYETETNSPLFVGRVFNPTEK